MNVIQKINELEKSVKRLEKISSLNKFNHVYSQKASEESNKSHSFKFKFRCNGDCYLKIESEIQVDASEVKCEYLINSVKAVQKKFYDKAFNFLAVLPFSEGINEVDVTISAEGEFNVENIIFQTCGSVEYVEESYLLSHVNESNFSLVAFLCDEQLTIRKYDENSFEKIITLTGVKSYAICSMPNKFLLAVVNKNGDMRFDFYDKSLVYVQSVEVDKSSINSVCAISGEKATLFAVKGSNVYRYEVNDQAQVDVKRTSYRAKKVISNPGVSDCIIIVDFNGIGKLVSL